jgi:ATP-dependent helicase Lhr and Lhr-like helicase
MATDAAEHLHPVIAHHIVNSLGWSTLRPLQAAAVEPILHGVDCLLLAPTAGGKTEAAVFPLLSRMAAEGWTGVSVLYVCPLRALLNNLAPRVAGYSGWLGRTAEVWHGDTSPATRRQIERDRPDILLTTPESLESMLVSSRVDSDRAFADLHVVVVDEVHAFAGDDRGWHLLHVLERLAHLAGRPLQRIGLSATVGNPSELLTWLQGSASDRPHAVIAPPTEAVRTEVGLDHVGSIKGAAMIVSKLHVGEKRLVFTDSRRRAEELGTALREEGVETYLSHSSLSAAERRRSEEAFAEARDCVIVATSTLELGIDVGDLVIQLGAPRTVASFLQRLGRTGRRPGSARNCLFLAVDTNELLRAAGLLLRWGQGWVEPVVPPASPRHIVAQQLLALALQTGRLGIRTWPEWWGGLGPMAADGDRVLAYLIDSGFLDTDGGLAFIGPEAERRFGRRHFSDLMAVFTAPPEFTVLAGGQEIGSVGNEALLTDTGGAPRVLLLAGHTWLVTNVDWRRRRCSVEQTDLPGRIRWNGSGTGLSYTLIRGVRDVLLGTDPPGVMISNRAAAALELLRQQHDGLVIKDATALHRNADGTVHWWTWAGSAANRSLHASLPNLVDPAQRINDQMLRLRPGVEPIDAAQIISDFDSNELIAPPVDERALDGLKFSAALPIDLASATVAERVCDMPTAAAILKEPLALRFADG